MGKAAHVLRIKAGSTKLVDYDSHAEQPEWMGRKKGIAARKLLDDGTYPMWTGFIMKGWREMHKEMKTQQIVTITRKIRGVMEEGRWKMWTARCDRVHRKDDEDTITERERTYAKIKQFWVQHVGMRRMDKSMVEVWLDRATIQFRFIGPSSFNTALQLVLRPHFLVHFV
jgi:hypothetical protein